MLYDDRRGVKEPLNETGVDGKGLIVRGRHIVVLDRTQVSTIYHRMLGEMLMLREYPLFVNDTGAPKDYMQKYTTNVRLTVFWGLFYFAISSSYKSPHQDACECLVSCISIVQLYS